MFNKVSKMCVPSFYLFYKEPLKSSSIRTSKFVQALRLTVKWSVTAV